MTASFVPIPWVNSPTTTTPLSAANLLALQTAYSGVTPSNVTGQTGSTYSANPGDVVYANPASGGITVTLPGSGGNLNTLITVFAGTNISGTNQVTVSNSGGFLGLGAVGVTTLPLGAPGAYVMCAASGAGWLIISGQQDTGWVPLSGMGQNANLGSGTGYTPAVRLRGDIVTFKGTPQTSASITANATLWTLPSLYRPASSVALNTNIAPTSGGSSATYLAVPTAGTVNVGIGIGSVPDDVLLDGLSYSLS